MEIYKRLSLISDENETNQIAAELIDRFGKLPSEVETLIDTIDLKALCKTVNIEKIEIIKDENMINEISYLSFEDLLEFETKNSLSEVKVHNQSKILTISLN